MIATVCFYLLLNLPELEGMDVGESSGLPTPDPSGGMELDRGLGVTMVFSFVQRQHRSRERLCTLSTAEPAGTATTSILRRVPMWSFHVRLCHHSLSCPAPFRGLLSQ